MRTLIKKCLLPAGIIILLFIVGCTTPRGVMQSWVGREESDLVSSWGAPDSMIELKDGTKVYTWKKAWNDNYGVHQGRQSFTISAEGKVVKWSYENMPAVTIKLW